MPGPASALYGSNALFGVANAVLYSGGDIEGVRPSLTLGSGGLVRTGVLAGRALVGGGQWLIGHTLRLSVRDNGRGLPTEETDEGIRFDLIGMRERAENIGGTLTVTGPPGQGVTVTRILPLPATQAAPTEESFR